jgi:hypothetical protein
MWTHRIIGSAFAIFGALILIGLETLQYAGSAAGEQLLIEMGIPGTLLLALFGILFLSFGVLYSSSQAAERRTRMRKPFRFNIPR